MYRVLFLNSKKAAISALSSSTIGYIYNIDIDTCNYSFNYI